MKGLNHDTNYGVSTNLPSVVLVGGKLLISNRREHGAGNRRICISEDCFSFAKKKKRNSERRKQSMKDIHVFFAGLSSEEKLHGVKYIIESFVGCIRNVTLSSGKSASDLLPITPLVATKHENVNEGCDNKCYSRHQNLCFYGSRCINHYNDISCDCFGLKYEGEHCDIYSKFLIFFIKFAITYKNKIIDKQCFTRKIEE